MQPRGPNVMMIVYRSGLSMATGSGIARAGGAQCKPRKHPPGSLFDDSRREGLRWCLASAQQGLLVP